MAILVGRPKQEIKERAKVIRAEYLSTKSRFERESGRTLHQSKLEEQAEICPICSRPIEVSSGAICEMDHAVSIYIYAQSRMPLGYAVQVANSWENLIVVHVECNTAKGRQEIEEFRERLEAGKDVLPDIAQVGVLKRAKPYQPTGNKRGRPKGSKCGYRYRKFVDPQKSKENRKTNYERAKENDTGYFAPEVREKNRTRGHQAKAKGIGIFSFSRERMSEISSKGGSFGNHNRWHVRRGISNPNCKLCQGALADVAPKESL